MYPIAWVACHHTEGIFQALWWFGLYTVLSVVLWLTFIQRSQGSTLYLSYQQQSDTLSVLLSNDIVGIKSWVNTGVKVYFGLRGTEWRTHGCFLQLVSVSCSRLPKASLVRFLLFPSVHVKFYHIQYGHSLLIPPNQRQAPNVTHLFTTCQQGSCWKQRGQQSP